MPFTNTQARKILHVKGEPFISPDRIPHVGMRLTESYLRRKLYSLEDRTVTQQWRTFHAAHADIRAYALQVADGLRLDKLERTYAAIDWQRQVMSYARERLHTAVLHTSYDAFRASLTAWYANYYGKAWQMDVNTRPDVHVNVPTPSQIHAHRNVLMPDMREAVSIEDGLYSLMGEEWRQRYADEEAEMLVKVRRGMERSMSEGHTVLQALRLMRSSIGIADTMDDGFTANFYRMQTLTRTAIMDGASDGAEAIWLANSDPQRPNGGRNEITSAVLLSLIQVVTARDERVCRICRGFDGQINSIFNAFRRRPPFHGNCRCGEVSLIIEALMTPDDALPQDTFGEWLTGFGAGMILDDFLGVGLESSVI